MRKMTLINLNHYARSFSQQMMPTPKCLCSGSKSKKKHTKKPTTENKKTNNKKKYAPYQDHCPRKWEQLEMWRDGITEALLRPLCCGNERECPFRKARVQLTVKDSPRLKGCYKELVQELLFNSLSKMFCRCKTMNTKSCWTNLKLKKINHKYINY